MPGRFKPVKDQVIVITGASSGIGLATARAAARRGACVVLSARDEPDLQRAVDEIQAEGGNAAYHVGDVADLGALEALAEWTSREFGEIDTWVNNAGVSVYGRIDEVPLEDARRLFETNYWGTVHGSLVALAHFRQRRSERKASLINVGSVLSETGYPLQGHYAASKHAVKGFTDSLRLEVEEAGLPVNITLIMPAAIDTPYPEHARNYLSAEPQHQPPVYAPEVVANAILACAQSAHRNLRVGASAKVFTVLEKTVPGLADRFKQTAFDAQHSSRPPRDTDTLYAPRAGDARVDGRQPGHIRQSSLYTTAALHPIASLIGAAAIGVGIAAVLRAGGDAGGGDSAGFDSGVDTPADLAVSAGVAY